MSRVDSVQIAIRKAGERVKGSVLASDAFFPFRDNVDTAAAAGVTAIVQPGGSATRRRIHRRVRRARHGHDVHRRTTLPPLRPATDRFSVHLGEAPCTACANNCAVEAANFESSEPPFRDTAERDNIGSIVAASGLRLLKAMEGLNSLHSDAR